MLTTLNRLMYFFAVAVFGSLFSLSSNAESNSIKVGVVVMHGKGGSPSGPVSSLAASLEHQGFLVANLEMPWSGKRDYDVSVSDADKEVEASLAELSNRGAKKLFVVGHSQGGAFAFSFGSRHLLDGIVVIAPGGDVSGQKSIEQFGDSISLAKKLIAEGKGNEKTRFMDFEGSKGAYPIITTPSSYITWFDPDGAMNQLSAISKINPATPVFYIAPKDDYPNLRKSKQKRFDALPQNPLTKLFEPNSSHKDAPSASRTEVYEWISTVVNAK